jgi:hypothetical protein
MRSLILCVVLVVTLLIVSATAKRTYTLETSVSGEGTWINRGSITVSKSKRAAFPTLKFTESEGTSDLHKELSTATMWRYRVVDDASGNVTASLFASPCTIVRGFETPSTEKLILPENVGVVVDSTDEEIVGLRLFGSTTLHHINVAASQCDLRILTLFPSVSLNLKVMLARSVSARTVTDFSDGIGGAAVPPPKKKDEAAADGSGTAKPDAEPDNRSFVERNWLYIVMIGVWMVVNGYVGATAKKDAKK